MLNILLEIYMFCLRLSNIASYVHNSDIIVAHYIPQLHIHMHIMENYSYTDYELVI